MGNSSNIEIAQLNQVLQNLQGQGVNWTLENSDELNINLVHLNPNEELGSHINSQVEVAVLVLQGQGLVTIESQSHELKPLSLILIPKETTRIIQASETGLDYLAIHKRKGLLQLKQKA